MQNLLLLIASGVLLFSPSKPIAEAATPLTLPSPFLYTFNSNGTIDEAGSMGEASSPYFWLNSGGRLIIQNGVGETVQGPLKTGDRWQLAYGLANALDTGNGYYPQNLFRLVTKSIWKNLLEEIHFKINRLNMTETPNRDGYSGVLLFSHYHDNDNLYYAGIRMDGTAVIKKKLNGTYYTLATAQIWNADSGYDKETNPNLIPGNRWMGMRTETKDLPDGGVTITLWLDQSNNGTWKQILSVVDTGVNGGAAVPGPAYAGIRTDYLDIDFDNYKLTEE